jgi:hypothetical protein
MAGKTAVKKQSGPPPKVGISSRVCSECGVRLNTNAIFCYKEIVFIGASASSRMRYTCKEHAKRTEAGRK